MLKRILDRFHMKKTDDKGSAIVVVILAIAFAGMLVAMLMYSSYVNFKMKGADRQAKATFYTAESALDEINAGLQSDISMIMTNAYTDVMKSAAKVTDENRKANFQTEFCDLFKKICNPGAQKREDFINHLISYWTTTPRYTATDGSYGDTTGKFGAYLELTNTGDAMANWYVEDEDIITLKGLRVTYINEKGYVSIIETDIVIKIPDLEFSANSSKPDLQMFSLVANNKLEKEVGGMTVDIAGSVYGGKDGIYASGKGSKMSFIFKDDDLKADAEPKEFFVAANSVNSQNRALIESGKIYKIGGIENDATGKPDIWVRDINTQTGDLDLDGKIYVQDDLNLDGTDFNGHGSNVKLSGSYIGFGDATNSASLSSSILVNGAKTRIDMSDLTQLMLSGHAYVGAMHYDANAKAESSYIEDLADATLNPDDYYNDPKDEYEKNEEDVVLGQSIAMKSDQLLYMVPTECMCYDNETGEQVLAKNPLTYDEYLKYTTTYIATGTDDSGNPVYSTNLKYRVVDLGKTFEKMEKSLQAAYGVSYRPVFRKVNGSILVYYYLMFDSDRQADQFFQDYYEADPDTIEQYAKSYLSELILNPDIESEGLLSLGGNAILYDGTDIKLKKSTYPAEIADPDGFQGTQELRAQYQSSFNGLTHFLTMAESSLTAEQLSRDVYNNLIDSAKFDSKVSASGTTYTRTVGTKIFKAFAIDNEGSSTPFDLSATYEDYNIIVASGDIRVTIPQFEGLIISGGNITIAPTCNHILYNDDAVLAAMRAKNDDDYFYQLFRNGNAYVNVPGVSGKAGEETEDTEEARKSNYVKVGDLIQYSNWTKK
ncbi:MAG: hypothetical protein E7294_11155 [Lachnospiraceae bacterium]|nr:hypothetical protein [Lachnospiraceae bacterium]